MRALLVDDHALFLEGLRNLLEGRDVEVVGTARDGLEAVERARALHPTVILMDIQMPRLDGFAAIRRIKAELPDTRVVMLTMSADDKDLVEAIRAGASGYLLKSDEPEAFFASLRGVERGEVALSPALAARILEQRSDESRRAAETASAPGALSPREVDILRLVAEGVTYRKIAERLLVSERTIKYHMSEIVSRLHVKGRLEAIEYARRSGLTR